MAQIKTVPKVVGIVVLFVGLFFGIKEAANYGLLPNNLGKILVPSKFSLPPVEDAQIPNVPPAPYPSTSPADVHATLIRGEIWEWNAQMGLLLANGGNNTTKGSFMEKRGVNLALARQDDTGKMAEDLIACAKEIHDGSPQCSTGANFVVIMGDGGAQFAATTNPQLKKLGPDYGLKIIGSVGYSRGEDSFMGPSSVKSNPKSFNTAAQENSTVPGMLIGGVLRDGDWNIAMKWAADNSIPNNPDETTYDADALNWINEPDYNTAASDYVAGKCEDRKEVIKGHLSGKTVHVCLNSVVTWTPGDVTAVEKRGGLVKIVSSKEYRSQMPAVIIGSAHFFNQNKPEIEAMLRAAFDGADQVKAYDAALKKAASISATVYGDQGCDSCKDGEYWYKYFHPVLERGVSLGGSAVNNLADNVILFGFDGNNNNMVSTFNVFRNVDFQQYPNLFKVNGPTPLPLAAEVIDRSYIEDISDAIANGDTSGTTAQADTQDFSQHGNGDVISRKSWSIDFASGSAAPLPDGEATLRQLLDQLAITGLKVKVDGYTDNTGSAQVNTSLSQARAQEVKTWLQQHAHKNFPDERFTSVEGHGPDNPVGDNSTAVGKAANRRVDIETLD